MQMMGKASQQPTVTQVQQLLLPVASNVLFNLAMVVMPGPGRVGCITG